MQAHYAFRRPEASTVIVIVISKIGTWNAKLCISQENYMVQDKYKAVPTYTKCPIPSI